ncbi:MAG TPA: PAS domain S-box protein [Polyangiaceae bacterium]|jgi:PAS domain S-box-containing protein
MSARAEGPTSLAEAVVESSLDGLMVLDREGRYVLWNRAMERFAGKKAEEVLGRRMLEVFPFLEELGLDRAMERALAGEVVVTEGVVNVEPDGARKVYDRVYRPLVGEGGEVTGVVAIVRDATASYVARDALRRSDAELRLAAEAAGIGLWSWDPATDALTWDDTTCAVFGQPRGGAPATRADYLRLVHFEDLDRATRRISTGLHAGEWEDEYRIVRPDGAVRWLTSKARKIQADGRDVVLGAVFDVTERKERDERLRATQRLEAVGQLTAGIAHNFNNMLMALLPNLEVAVRRAPQDLVPLLETAEQAAQRAADLVRQLMTYAGRSLRVERRAEALGPLVERTVTFCRTTFDRRIALTVRCDEGAAAAVDASQIEQAVLNLLINARDALDDAAGDSPRAAVTVERVPEGEPDLEGRVGSWVRICVSDNGVGMDVATAQRVYEPFFTTKEVGRGTGLGLSTTHGIVREHGGFIACRTSPGKGATFSVYLPGVTRPASVKPSGKPSSAPPLRPRSGALVLVVDDDAPVREVVSLMLNDAGFDVRTAPSGELALALLEDADLAARTAVVLLDVSMPGLPRGELRARLRERVPRVEVVYLTGYAYEAPEGDLVLEKPVTEARLVTALDAALARSQRAGGRPPA